MGGRWKSQNRKIVPLSPYVEKPLNSKVIKSFVPELRNRKCFSCFDIPMFYVYIYIYIWTSHVHLSYSCIWLWYRKMEQILLAYGLPKENVAAIMVLYRNTKVKVHSPDGDTDYFGIVAGVLQGDTLAPYFFIICLDYVLRTSIDKLKENGFELTKKRSRRYLAKTITDTDYADDIVILVNSLAQAETLLHCLERAAAGIGLHVNAHKTEYMCYNQRGDISTLNCSSLKLVDKLTYLESSVSSTETDIDTRLTKAWTAINRLLVIWKSDLIDKMKCSFFQAAIVSILLYGCTTWTLTKRKEKKLDSSHTILKTPQSSSCMVTYHPSSWCNG